MRKIMMKDPDTNRTKNTKRWLGWLSFCMLLLVGQVGFAQVNSYSFTQTISAYQSIVSDGTLVVGSEATTSTTNDTNGWSVSLPFAFNFNAVDYASIYVNSNGGATFGTTTSNGSSLISSSSGYSGAVSVMDRDLWGVFITSGVTTSGSNLITNVASFRGVAIGKDLASGTGIPTGTTITAFDEGAGTITMSKNATSNSSSAVVRYGTGKVFTKVEGATPNRVFTIQWEGYNDYITTASNSNYLSFQLKLTESANTVQIVFGNHYNISTTARTSQLGLRGATNTDYNNRTGIGTTPWNTTTSGTSNSATVSRNNVNFPVSGLTFTWTPPSCLAPSTLAAINVTSNSADLTWSGAGSNFDIEWGIQGFPQGSGTTVSGVSPYTLGGLSANTPYSYYVRQNCGGGEYSTWAGPYSFRTSCVAGTIPFFEGFETGYTHANVLGNCWSQQDIAGTQKWMVNSTFTNYNRTPKSGSFNTTLQYSNTDWIFYPLDLTGGVAYELKFYARQDATSGASIEAAYGTSNTAAAMVNSIITSSAVANGDYQEFSGFFTPATNGVYYFGIKATLTSSPWHISLDDISVIEAPNCLQPLDLASTNPTTSSIDLSWNGAGGASGNYEVKWGVVGFDIDAATASSVSGQSYTANGTGGNYEFVVREICSGSDQSVWSARKAFRIPNVGEDCSAPIVIGALPYATTDDTANYTDNPNIENSPGASGCGTTAYYLTGNDVVYSYTATTDGVIQVKMTPTGTWSGIFAYASCADIGTACIGGASNTGSAVNLFELNVTNGETYYFVISTNAAPQTVAYTLEITEVLCAKPSDVVHSNITHNSADLSWVGNALGNYDINWGTGSFLAGAGTNNDAVTAATEFSFTGLSGSTLYRYFVRQNCGGTNGESDWVGPYTFTTALAPATIPWNEAFTGTTFPTGWTNTSSWSVSTSTTIVPGAEGSYLQKEIWSTAGSAGVSFSTLRMGLVSANDVLSFDYGLRKYGSTYTANGTIAIEISTDNGTNYSPFQTITHTDDVTWTSSGNYDLSLYAGQYIRIRITATRVGSSDDYYLGFDNFFVGVPPTCPAPSALTTTAVTSNSADISWTAGNTETAWNMVYGATGFDPNGATVNPVTPNPNTTITGLSANTVYEFYVQADCGGDDSTWAGPVSFKTEALVAPTWEEGFLTTTAPQGWTTTGWLIGSTRGVTGNPGNNIYKNFYASAATGTFTTINVGPVATGQELSFDYKASLYSSPYNPIGVNSGSFTVSISTDYGQTYDVVDNIILPNDNAWQSESYSLAAYVGEIIKIKIEGTRTAGDYDLAFDNFFVGTPPSCPAPTALVATSVSSSSANISWAAGGTESEWNVVYGANGFDPNGATLINVTPNANTILSGLSAGTTYQFYVKADCGSEESTWAGPVSFSTPPSNDNCGGAIALDCNAAAVTYSSAGSTALAPAGCTIGKNGIWFSFVGTGTDITINSTASFDHKMSMQTGTCATLSWIACQDGSTGAETYTIEASELGQMYYVYVAHYSSTSTTTGNITISIECAAPACSAEWTGFVDAKWNTAGNWCDNTVPTAGSNVVINNLNPAIINTDVSIASITLGADANLTVNGSLEVGNISVAAGGSLVVANDANLIQTATAVNSGNITVKRNAVIKHLDYTIWSSPVVGQGLQAFSPNTLASRIYQYNTSTDAWEITTGNFTAGKGIMFRAPNLFDDGYYPNAYTYQGSFTGTPHNGDVTVNFTQTGTYQGVGNPYPSNMDIGDFWTTNAGTGTLYFWTNTNAWNNATSDYVANNWATYSDLGGTAAANSTKVPVDVVSVGQGFVVEAPSLNSVTFNNDMRTAQSGVFFRTAASDKHRLWLNLSDATNGLNQILIGYMDGATQGEDLRIDSKMFNYEGSALYSLIDGNQSAYTIQGRSLPFDDFDVVPLGFRAMTSGAFTISLSNFDGVFAQGQDIFLKDNLTQTQHNLKDGDYTFVSNQGEFATRFEVVYRASMDVTNPELDTTWVVYAKDKTFFIETQGFDIKEVMVYDMLGRVVYQSAAQGNTHAIAQTGANQVLIVKVITANNEVLTKKVNN